ncbi:MAG: hypothetical protein BGO12_23840 [Verrucomicrobia bacterium 61-8]|nr:hypothetical protein [Verrucomicrobiota bacterium]OJV02492.1 MAG: hypothetical protein BGO12_23840 [Verrucomicrobia bacterium 61-8]
MSQTRLLHLASGVVQGHRVTIEVVMNEDEPRGSVNRFRVSFRGFAIRRRGQSYAVASDAERVFIDNVDAFGLEVRW